MYAPIPPRLARQIHIALPLSFRRTRMGILDVVLGRDAQGNPSKINMALNIKPD